VASFRVFDEEEAHQGAPDRSAQHDRDGQEQEHHDRDDDSAGNHGPRVALEEPDNACKGSGTGAPSLETSRGGLVEERSSDRWLALAGIVFVVLVLISGFLPGSPPKPSDSAAKIAKFVTNKNDELRWAGFVGALGSVVLLAWIGAVWRLLRRAEGGVPRMAVGAALGAGMAAALFNVGGVLMSAVAIAGAPTIGKAETRFVYILFTGMGAAGGVALALFVGAFSIVIIETGVLPRVMGWLGALVTVILLAAGGAIASSRDVFFVLGFIGFIGFALWVLVVSVMMYRAVPAEPAPLAP
jgi:hypothetical protein